MEIHRVAHFACDVFGFALPVQRSRATALERDAVDFGMAAPALLFDASVVDDDRIRLMLPDDGVEFGLMPVGVFATPVAVEPEAADLSVARTEDLDAVSQILQIAFPV